MPEANAATRQVRRAARVLKERFAGQAREPARTLVGRVGGAQVNGQKHEGEVGAMAPSGATAGKKGKRPVPRGQPDKQSAGPVRVSRMLRVACAVCGNELWYRPAAQAPGEVLAAHWEREHPDVTRAAAGRP